MAYRLFVDKGFKSTSLEEITSSVGIAKSTFYVFFESKEMLYMTLLAQEGERVEQQVWTRVAAARDTRSAIKTYLHEMVMAMETNVLTARMVYDLEEYKLVCRKLNPYYVGSENLRSIVPLTEFIQSRQAVGALIEEEPQVIAGVLKSAMLIGAQKGNLEPYNYERMRELLFEAVANQMTRTEG
ncbi:TetR/AcrR family transcriptional regulator [Paenibacillus daejeonensis]|uniref:TetR/AcrR family transcriptional regulator n=1 Tax=Paenibacillus daejeonensis TaxID=135193 RepID=UPI000370DA37|nr:TetR/AcrR family transcriptional regulator [Paenibacillus daejeonensis]